MTERGTYYGSTYDRYTEVNEDSTSHKLKNAYWNAKQVVIAKLGRKEDEHVVASDSELDAKLELFHSIQKTCMDLMRILEKYQDKICMLSQAENELGRFLKTNGTEDKTRAGKMMTAVGKSMSFSAQQRLALRVPLSRLQQEVETFRYRAISDTLQTVSKMEQKRTEYRAALLWMKDVSENLDPDTFKQLDKFRKVQAQVRKTKSRFDKIKLDSMQKVDLLAASRCNMFSHVLSLYQSTLLQFWEKTCRTMVAVADSFKGYQYYEFSMLKDLTDESKKLAQLTRRRSSTGDSNLLDNDNNKDEDKSKEVDDFEELNKRLDEIFTGEYKDDPGNDIKAAIESNKQTVSKKQASNPTTDKQNIITDPLGLGLTDVEDQNDRALLEELLLTTDKDSSLFDDFIGQQQVEDHPDDWMSLFSGVGGGSHGSADIDTNLLGSSAGINGSSQQQQRGQSQASQMLAGLMPSALLDRRGQMGSLDAASLLGGSMVPFECADGQSIGKGRLNTKNTSATTQSNAAWLTMFADLDPLANPDLISKKEGQITDT